MRREEFFAVQQRAFALGISVRPNSRADSGVKTLIIFRNMPRANGVFTDYQHGVYKKALRQLLHIYMSTERKRYQTMYKLLERMWIYDRQICQEYKSEFESFGRELDRFDAGESTARQVLERILQLKRLFPNKAFDHRLEEARKTIVTMESLFTDDLRHFSEIKRTYLYAMFMINNYRGWLELEEDQGSGQLKPEQKQFFFAGRAVR